MAPNTRSKKPKADPWPTTGAESASDANAVKLSEKKVKGKRKAAETDSPVPKKVQKSANRFIIKKDEKKEEKPAKKSTKKSAPATEETEEASGSGSDSEEENVEAQELMIQLDPEDEITETDAATVYKPGQPVGQIPDVAQAVEKAAKKSTGSGEPGVIYIGRIPHGFYEHEMRQYFTQFGVINKLRLSRNKQTGASKHFAFVEFAEASTADIVAKTMDNYLLFGHILKCRTIPKEQVREDLFKGSNKRFKKVPWNKMAGLALEKPQSESAWEKKVAREQEKRAKKAAALKAIGYEFEAPGIKDVPPPAEIEEFQEIEIEETHEVEDQDEDEKVEEAIEEKPEPKTISAPKKAGKGKATKGKSTRKTKA